MGQCILNRSQLLQICKVSYKGVGSCFIVWLTKTSASLMDGGRLFFAVETTILLKLYTQFLNRRIFCYVI